MVDLKYFLFQLWEWIVNHGIPLLALLLCAILLPRVGRMAVRVIARQFTKGEEATKSRLALIGALVYVIQAIGYFVIIMLALTNLGVPPVGAALPATVVSAAIGFGSQKIIGDFLAGFFIISERQFGVGDFVSFDGTSNQISGTVVALTLRATKVRTAAGELVTVPNGSAGVITNYSQEWSRAVVNLSIPLQPGETMDNLVSTVESTVYRAVKDPAIASDVRGQIEILPATEIIAPVAAGQPWSVNFRVNAEVNPAMQWSVERVIRSALLNVFWDRYDLPGSPYTATTALPAQDSSSGNSSTSSLTDPSHHDSSRPASSLTDATAPATKVFPSGKHSTEAVAQSEIAPTREVQASEAATPEAKRPTDDTGPQVITAAPGMVDDDGDAAPIAPSDHGPGKGLDTDSFSSDELEEFEPQRQVYDSKLKNALSLGGRVRWDTTALIIALCIVGMLAIFSSNPEGGNAGVLSPDKWRKTESATTAPTTAQPSPTRTEESSPAETQSPTETPNTDPNQGTNPNQPTDTDQGNNGLNSNGNGQGSEGNSNQPRGNSAPKQGNQSGSQPTGGSSSGNRSGGANTNDSTNGEQNGATDNPPGAIR